MSKDEVTVVLKDLPTTARGFVTIGSGNEPIIVLNSRMTVEQQHKTFLHEMNHINSGHLDDEDYDEYGDVCV